MREEQFKDTETTQKIGKHVPISVSISSNLIESPIFLCNSNPRDLVESFVVALESLAAQSKAQMKLQFLDIETSIKSRLNAIFAVLNERRGPRETVLEFGDECLEFDKKKRFYSVLANAKKINSLTCRNTLKDIATCYQSLASIVSYTTLTLPSVICYPH